MTDEQRADISEILNAMADECQPDDEYIFCLRVERVANGVMHLGIDWQMIHDYVKAWLRGDI
jgi:hypothetical protein